VSADRARHLARVVERMGADVRLRAPTREGRLGRVQDARLGDRSRRSVRAATRELRRRRTWADTAGAAPAPEPAAG
jgi:hypothetical protein